MKRIPALLLFILLSSGVNAQELYTRSFGNPASTPVIFLHGGPGYNSVPFEVTTAEKLSQNGFYVIIYDRRGEGRSKDTAARFTFQ